MKIRYVVHSAVVASASVDAVVAGKNVVADVQMLTIEAVSVDGAMGHTFRFMVDDPAGEAAKFVAGTAIDVTITVAEAEEDA